MANETSLLLITEYGVLYTQDYGISSTQVKDYLTGSFDYLLTASDAATGYPADENRLVQGWVWYSLNDTSWNGYLFNPTNILSEFGTAWKNYVTDPAKPLVSQPQLNLLVTNLRTEPAFTLESESPVTFTLKVDIANSGNTTTSTGNHINVSFWDSVQNQPGSNQIGSAKLWPICRAVVGLPPLKLSGVTGPGRSYLVREG